MTSALNEDMCPVPLELLGALYRADPEQLETMLGELAEPIRARLAVYLYGRSHTHRLGLRIAAGCDAATLRRASGLIGDAVYEQSRRPPAEPSFHGGRGVPAKKISLGGAASLGGLRA